MNIKNGLGLEKSWCKMSCVMGKWIGVVGLFLVLSTVCQAQSLKECIDTALKSNPGVLTSQKKADAANARLAQAVGAFLPTVKLNGNYTKTYSQPTRMSTSLGIFTLGTSETGTVSGWSASLSQPIFVAGLFPGYGLARKSADIADTDLVKTVLDTKFNVTQAYFNVIAAAEMSKLADESKKMASSHLDQVNKMLNAGVATEADRLRSEVQLANAELSLTRSKNSLELAKNSLNNALNRPLTSEFTLDKTGFTDNLASLPSYTELLSFAFQERPDWKQYQLGKGMAEDNLHLALTAYLPSVFLNGQMGNQNTNYSSFQYDSNSWTITGAASWTLFDGLGVQNKIREAAANLDAQKANEAQVKNGIELQVREAYLNLMSAIEALASSKKLVNSAEENFKVADRRFNSGAGTNIEVIDAQVALTQAKVNYTKSGFDIEVGKAKINNAVGKEVL